MKRCAPWWFIPGVLLPLGRPSAQDPLAQRPGALRGLVMDQDFDTPLAGAEVQIVETRQKTTTSDQGNFVFQQVAPGRYTLVFTKDGYLRQVRADVAVTSGQLTDVSVSLPGDFTEMDELLVQDLLEFGAGTEAALLQLRLDSPSLMDSIGVEMMSRAGASDAATALRLVSGASLQDGKSAVIRGLPDRYVSSQMNGVRLPTADENKRAVELDQFPAAVLESLQVSKTFTPDQQGEASGGAVNVRLRGVPDDPFFLRFRTQATHNPQANGRSNFLSYDGGGVNYFAKDHGSRPIQFDNLGRNWTGAVGVTEHESPDLDGKWSVAGGGNYEISRGVKVGGFASLFHERNHAFYEDGRDDSYWVESPGAPMTPRTSQGTRFDPNFRTALFDVTQGKESVKWGSLATLGIRSERHSVGLTWLYTRTADDTATLAEDTRGKQFFFPGHNPDDPTTPGHNQRLAAPYLRLETLAYTERTTETFQLHGTHTFPLDALGTPLAPELDWTLAHSSADLNEPDKRQFGSAWLPARGAQPAVYIAYKPDATFSLGNLQRIFKRIGEESDQVTASLKFPFAPEPDGKGYLKVGGMYDDLERRFNQETFSNFNDNTAFRGPFSQFWSARFPFENHAITESTFDVDYKGSQRIAAAYAMLDLPLTSFMTLIGGVRFEATNLGIINFPEADATWFPPGATGPTVLRPGDADVRFEQDDWLPSVGLVINPIERVTIRAAYNETIARQTFKELTPIIQQEFLGGPIFIGNPDLQMSALRNYDLRLDYTAYDGGLFSASWFRKDIKRPIEYQQRITSFDFTTAVNYPRGELDGFELETRQSLGMFWDTLDGIRIGANATFIRSKVNLPADEIARFNEPGIKAPMSSRDMTNAPEYLYNLYATYDLTATGTQAGIFYTVQGDTLISGAGTTIDKFVPSIYALRYDTLNVTLTQDLGKSVRLQLAAKNLTDPDIQEAYRSPYIGGDITRSSYTKGIEYSVTLSWEVRL